MEDRCNQRCQAYWTELLTMSLRWRSRADFAALNSATADAASRLATASAYRT